MKITFTLNGAAISTEVHPGARLVDVLRELGFMGTKYGCGTGECGACVVLVDGEPMNSCIILAPVVDGHDVITIEGIGTRLSPHPIQEEYVKAGAVQCGFCTPGMILSTFALLQKNPDPTRDEITAALDGNLCRCTGYVKIVDAVLAAARRLRGEMYDE